MGKVLTWDSDISLNPWTTGLDRGFSHYSFNIYEVDYINPFMEKGLETEHNALEQAGIEALDLYDGTK